MVDLRLRVRRTRSCYHGPPGQYFTPASYLILRSLCLWVMAGERRRSSWHLFADRACYRLQLPVLRKLRTFRTGSGLSGSDSFPSDALVRSVLRALPPNPDTSAAIYFLSLEIGVLLYKTIPWIYCRRSWCEYCRFPFSKALIVHRNLV